MIDRLQFPWLTASISLCWNRIFDRLLLPENHFRYDVERAEDVEDGKSGQDEYPDSENEMEAVAGPNDGP